MSRRVTGLSIILLHPWQRRTHTQQAMRMMIPELQAQGYRFVTVDELLTYR